MEITLFKKLSLLLGSFVFIEASAPRQEGDRAALVTPVLPSMVYCLQFGYHAYGDEQISALHVYRQDGKGKKHKLIELNQNYGNKWQYVLTTVASAGQFQVRKCRECS